MGWETLYIAHLNSNRARKAVSLIQEELRTERHTGTVEYKLMDLASLESVRKCAKEVNDLEGRIDILVLNAGEGGGSRSRILLGVRSWVRFCRQEFGEFPRLVGRYCSYLLPKQAGGTPQILVFKTLRMKSRPALYSDLDHGR